MYVVGTNQRKIVGIDLQHVASREQECEVATFDEALNSGN